MAHKRGRPGFILRLERRPVVLGSVALLVASVAAAAMTEIAGTDATRSALERIAPVWLAAAVGARLLAYLGYTLAHHRVMSACDGSEIEVGTAARVVAFGAGATSLRGGFSIDARALRGAGASRPRARAHVAALAMLEYAVLAAGAWAGALLLLGVPYAQAQVVWPWAVGVPAGTAVVAGAFIVLSRRTQPRGERVRSLIRGGEILAGQAQRPGRALAAVAGMILYWAAEIGALWASLRAFGVTCTPQVAVVGYATGYVLTPRGLPLAGAGIAEVLVPLSLHWLGVPIGAAIVGAFAAELTRLLVSLPCALAAHGEIQELVESAA